MKTFYEFGEIIKSETQFAFFGVPWDALTTKKGVVSRNAPERIRAVSYDLALTTELGVEIPSLPVCDMGNVEINSDETKNIQTIERFIGNLYDTKPNIVPVMIGGDHFCTYPVYSGINKVLDYENVGILVFDAHLDFYNTWEGNQYSHATISHRLFDLEDITSQNLLILGTRDIDIPEKDLAGQHNLKYFNAYELNHNVNEFIQRIINFFHDSNIEQLYLSIDIDVLDPSIAPGTGYAIPGCFSYPLFSR